MRSHSPSIKKQSLLSFDEGHLLSPSDESTLRQESEALDLSLLVGRLGLDRGLIAYWLDAQLAQHVKHAGAEVINKFALFL